MELSNKPFIHLFRTRNQYYFYDVNKNEIVKISDSCHNNRKMT